MKYVDVAALQGKKRLYALSYLHDAGLSPMVTVDDAIVEDLDRLSDDELGVSHPVVKAPGGVGFRASLDPVGYVELDTPTDVYAVVEVRFGAGQDSDSDDFQCLIVPDERAELVAYSTVDSAGRGMRRVKLQVNDAPDKQVVMSVPVEAGQFVEPPQGAAGMPAGRVVGLRCFDEFARPVGDPVKFELAEGVGTLSDGVGQGPGAWWRVAAGVVDGERVHESVHGGPQLVEPLTESKRNIEWEHVGGLNVKGHIVTVALMPLSNRIRLDVCSSDVPHLLSVRVCPFDPGVEGIEVAVHRSIHPDRLANETVRGVSHD